MGLPEDALQVQVGGSLVYSQANDLFNYDDWVNTIHAEADRVRAQDEQKEVGELKDKIEKLKKDLGDGINGI